MLSQLTQLKDTGIYVIEVPEYCKNFQLNEDEFGNNDILFSDVTDNSKHGSGWSYELPEHHKWQILGTITSDNISFDPAPYIDKCNVYFPDTWEVYRDYTRPFLEPNKVTGEFRQEKYCDTPDESFYTLLNSCGIEIDNKLHLALIKNPIRDINALKELIGDNKPA